MPHYQASDKAQWKKDSVAADTYGVAYEVHIAVHTHAHHIQDGLEVLSKYQAVKPS